MYGHTFEISMESTILEFYFNTLDTSSSQLLHASNRAASAVPHLSCFGLLRFNSRNA